MKNSNEGTFKGFTQLSKAWYGKSNLEIERIEDNITFGFYAEEGGTTGEMSVNWVHLGGRIVPEWTIFSDGWNALSNFHDLIDLLGQHDDEDPSPEQFREYLIECGFIDITKTKNPYKIETK